MKYVIKWLGIFTIVTLTLCSFSCSGDDNNNSDFRSIISEMFGGSSSKSDVEITDNESEESEGGGGFFSRLFNRSSDDGTSSDTVVDGKASEESESSGGFFSRIFGRSSDDGTSTATAVDGKASDASEASEESSGGFFSRLFSRSSRDNKEKSEKSGGGGVLSIFSGGSSSLVGSWKRDDGYSVIYSRSAVEMFDNRGSPLVKGNWSTKGDQLTVTATHFYSNLFGEAAPMFGLVEGKWYTIAELRKAIEGSIYGFMADEFIDMAEYFSATGTYVIEGNKLTFYGPTGVIENYTRM